MIGPWGCHSRWCGVAAGAGAAGGCKRCVQAGEVFGCPHTQDPCPLAPSPIVLSPNPYSVPFPLHAPRPTLTCRYCPPHYAGIFFSVKVRVVSWDVASSPDAPAGEARTIAVRGLKLSNLTRAIAEAYGLDSPRKVSTTPGACLRVEDDPQVGFCVGHERVQLAAVAGGDSAGAGRPPNLPVHG